MKKIFLTTVIFFSCQFVNAAEKVTPEQNYMNRESVRQDYARRVAAANEKNLSAIRNSSSGTGVNKTVISQINSTSSASDGSAVKGGATVTKPVDAVKVGKTMAERLSKAKALGKASLPSFLGSAALTALVQGVGWIIDEGGKVTKTVAYNPQTVSDPTLQYVWKTQSNMGGMGTYVNPSDVCAAYNNQLIAAGLSQRVTGVSLTSGSKGYCQMSNDTILSITRIDNIYYDASVPQPQPQTVPVTETDLQNTVANYITNNDNSVTNNIINNSYSYDSSNGATPSDASNALVVDTHKDMGNAITNAASAPYNSGTPTKGSYLITDGNKTVQGHVDTGTTTGTTTGNTTTTNPDGSTSTGETESEFTLPAFCDWASIVCEWINWTKEEPELVDTPLVIEEQAPVSYQHQEHIRFGQSCPFFPEMAVLPMGVLGEIKFMKDLTFICDWGLIARPYIIGLGYLGSLMFLLYGIRNGNA